MELRFSTICQAIFSFRIVPEIWAFFFGLFEIGRYLQFQQKVPEMEHLQNMMD